VGGITQAVAQTGGNRGDGAGVGGMLADGALLLAPLGEEWVEPVIGDGARGRCGEVVLLDLPGPGLVIDAGVFIADHDVGKVPVVELGIDGPLKARKALLIAAELVRLD